MLATTVPEARRRSAVTGDGWVLERKLDGLRCIAMRGDGKVTLWSRNRLPYTARFPDVVHAVSQLPAPSFVLDGEVVAFDERDRSSFSLLQRPLQAGTRRVYSVFDVLEVLGRDTTGLALSDRRALLSRLITPDGVLEFPEQVSGDPEAARASACARGWEGLVAKRADSTYQAGRSSDWLKLKCVASQELVVGGWTDPRASREGFGALLVGYHDDTGLRYAGKVGTGFDAATLHRIRGLLDQRAQPASPFVDAVPEKAPHWVRPDLVAAVGFTEWTTDGRLRHPRFEGLRDDKDAAEVVREQTD